MRHLRKKDLNYANKVCEVRAIKNCGPSLHSQMAPPSKRVARLRAIAVQRWSSCGSLPVSDSPVSLIDSDAEVSDECESYWLESDIDVDEGVVDHAESMFLKWKDGAKLKRPAVYSGDSRWSKWRRGKKRAEMIASVVDCHKITDFFNQKSSEDQTSQTEITEIISSDDDCSEDLNCGRDISNFCSLDEAIEITSQYASVAVNRTHEQRLRNLSKYDYVRYMSLHRYFFLVKSGMHKMTASSIASALFPARSVPYQSRNVRKWAQFFLEHRSLPHHRQGKHIKADSLIYEEDVASHCRRFLKSQVNDSITGRSFANWVNDKLHLETGLPNPVLICERTAIRWLHHLGMDYLKYAKGLYIDGHERPDVIQYRDAFLQRMAEHEKFFFRYCGDDMNTITAPILQPDQRPRILVTHDESCFSSHDGKATIWLDANDRPLRPKGQGRSIMVSEFICECHGPMKLNDHLRILHPDIPSETCSIILPGKNQDGYWTTAHQIDQVKNKAMPIFKVLHPEADALFLFDNSQNHRCLPPDALRVSTLNLSDGGKNVLNQRPGWFINSDGVRVCQVMQRTDGVQKGIRTILMERDLWSPSLRLNEARELLARQPDFQSQLSWLEETLRAESGFFVDFYPKFHCEFNFIELYWGAVKSYARRNCNYTFRGLQSLLPQALASVSLQSVRKFARKCYRYMDAYRITDENGNRKLTPAQVEFAVKKFKKHRSIPLTIFKEL